jgi:hypothetical protein
MKPPNNTNINTTPNPLLLQQKKIGSDGNNNALREMLKLVCSPATK